MTPKHFIALAAAAAVSLVVAVGVYSSSVPWTHATQSGTPLFATLPARLRKLPASRSSRAATSSRWSTKAATGASRSTKAFPPRPRRCAPFW